MNIEELKKPLDRAKVKTRDKGNTQLSYIESWHAIDEANRIFGFDGWSRETIYCKEISRVACKVGKGDYAKDGWKVGYEAKVRICVMSDDVVVHREGTGHGSGQMVDLFDCIESAAKEAESDAMKRALMTFGNPFGLALYDKTQKNVEDAPKVSKAPKVDDTTEVDKLNSDILNIFDINVAAGSEAFKSWWGADESKADRVRLRRLNADYYNKLQAKYLAAVEVFIKQKAAISTAISDADNTLGQQ